jgi:hypothetical protein
MRCTAAKSARRLEKPSCHVTEGWEPERRAVVKLGKSGEEDP